MKSDTTPIAHLTIDEALEILVRRMTETVSLDEAIEIVEETLADVAEDMRNE